MRRLLVPFVFVGLLASFPVGIAQAKSGRGTMCVLHARLSAQNETTGSTSTATGHTQIKVREDGTIEFKTQINNRNHEGFTAGHVHQAPVGVAGPIVVPLLGTSTPLTMRHIKQSGVATPNAGTTGSD